MLQEPMMEKLTAMRLIGMMATFGIQVREISLMILRRDPVPGEVPNDFLRHERVGWG